MAQILPQTAETCQSCQFFDDYQDERGRGWCKAFNNPARRHHRKTPDCLFACQEPPTTVRVKLHTKAIAIERDLHPFPVDSQVATVNNFPTETLKAVS
jgi:hypothetical protein